LSDDMDTQKNNTTLCIHSLFVLVLAGLLILNACASTAGNQPAATPAIETAQPIPTETPSVLATTLSQAVCQESGTLTRHELDSPLLRGTLAVSVYLPPCYDALKADGYPSLYLLHGQTFTDSMWLDLGAAQIADEMIASGGAPPFIMVMPFEEFYYRKAEGNVFPDVIVDELLPWVEETFNACPDRACRALGGISRGASWSVRIGLTHWQAFSTLGLHSLPDFLGRSEAVAAWLENVPKDSYPRIYMDSGTLDTELKIAAAVELVMNQKAVPHEWHLNEGRHDLDYWQAHVKEYLQWYARGWMQSNLQTLNF
jgi:enterochelin esterase-like enzyme